MSTPISLHSLLPSRSLAQSTIRSKQPRTKALFPIIVTAAFGVFCFHVGVTVGIDVGQRRLCDGVVAGGGGGGGGASTNGEGKARVGKVVAASAADARRLVVPAEDSAPEAAAVRSRKALRGDEEEVADGTKRQRPGPRTQLNPDGPAKDGCKCECDLGTGRSTEETSKKTSSAKGPEAPPQRDPPRDPSTERKEEHVPPTLFREEEDGLRIVRETWTNLVAGAAVVKRNDFFDAAVQDAGVPIDPSKQKKDDVLILYTSEASLPNRTSTGSTRLSPAAKAVENCQSMKVVFTEFDVDSNCIAIVGYPQEASHIHRFHRVRPVLNENGGNMNKIEAHPDAPLRRVPRHVNSRGELERAYEYLPTRGDTDRYMEELVRYTGGMKKTLDALRPIAKAAAATSADRNTVIAIPVNHGHSELLANLVCSALARNLDLSQVLVFATDPTAAKVAESLGLKAFDATTAFGSMPTGAAEYGDRNFGRIMAAKTYCVHMLLWLGHNVLLQDADVLWMRHPLEFFTPERTSAQDLILMDDGSRHLRYAPYFANAGFYFARSNDRTAFLFSSLVRMGDVLDRLLCDQELMSMFMNEHVSWSGLKVEVLPHETEYGSLFPSGHQYWMERDTYMTKLLKGEIKPYVFHMNWTPNADAKFKYLAQLGEWRLKSSCLNATAAAGNSSALACCSAQPLVECHYRDLPSPLDCKDYPRHY